MTPVTDEFSEAYSKHLALARAGNDHHFIVFLIDSIRALRTIQSAPGWHRDAAGNVVITMTPDDYSCVVFMLGQATGDAIHDRQSISPHLALLNRLNVGNPNYTPYQVEPEAAHG